MSGTIVTSATAEVRRKPVSMQLVDTLARLTGKKSLYAYADRVIEIQCPRCRAEMTMTPNVRIAQCTACEAVVQRS
jgi:hypothetical protein